MPTKVRSYSKINLGLAIGPPRPDGFHALSTLYQTVALHDVLTVSARRSPETKITLSSSHPRVPVDARNTVWKMVEKALEAAGVTAEVAVHIQKNLPIQGGMGAGSANAASALLGLERELGVTLPRDQRMAVAAAVGSDVPLFLVGGSVLGWDRGQEVAAVGAVTLAGSAQIPCVIALPPRGVSTPQAFRDWDARFTGLQSGAQYDIVGKLSRIYASVFGLAGSEAQSEGNKPVFPDPDSGRSSTNPTQNSPANMHGLSCEQPHQPLEGKSGMSKTSSETLPALIAQGIENDFEKVVFLQYPLLAELKQQLLGPADAPERALYASLSGSGSALFGLYRSQGDATAAQQRLQQHGVQAIVTTTLPRPLYWSNLFA